jgi:hypothetical protein
MVRNLKDDFKYNHLKAFASKPNQIEFVEGEIGKPFDDLIKGTSVTL